MNNFKNEKDIYQFWLAKNYFAADPKSSKKPYSLLIPPPNLTGELHLGHAMQHSILDALARFKRLQGFDVLLLPGVDHAGIQFEATFNKFLEKQGLSKFKMTREEWLNKAWEFKEEIYEKVSDSWKFMGLSADWSREVFTLDRAAQKAVFEEFKTYYEKGLIYKGPYIVQWCPKDNTAIEDAEVEYEERKEKLYYMKYGPLTLATARPETKFGDTAMAVNPNDKRYKKYIDQEFEIMTLSGLKKMKVVADEAVDPDFGTGVIKVTPGHSFEDYEIGKRHNLPIVNVINKQGKLTEIAGKYAGMKVMEARAAMLPELRDKGILIKEEEYVHKVPICERCKSVVEPIISEEWFVKVEDLAKEAIKAINTREVKFLPPGFAKILVDWLDNIHDWCISRSLWWGHRIPVWYRGDEKKVSLESPGEGWVQDEQVLDTWFSSGLWPLTTLGWPGWSDKKGRSLLASLRGRSGTDGTLRTDLSVEKYFPWDFEISAPEIKFLWIARMIMISKYFTGKAPFKTMFFHGMLRDLEGRKFSKSLGNGIDPMYLIDKWGVDATRMALYSYSIPGRDGRVSKAILDERGKNYRNFGTKLRNITKFILELNPEQTVILNEVKNLKKDPSSSTQDDNKKIATSRSVEMNVARNRQSPAVLANAAGLDKEENSDDDWIMGELEKLIGDVTKYLENIELHLAAEAIYEFVWHEFADIYIEKTKERRMETQPMLEHILKQTIILLHPFMPFLTEEIYQQFEVKKESVMLEEWPS